MKNPQAQLVDSCSDSDDENAWDSRIPDDLTLTILSKLPTLHLLRVRSVCKKWNEAVTSPAFLRLCSTLPARPPLYLGFQGFRHERGWAYDPASTRWYSLSFSFLPGLGRCAAAAGGLLCFCQDNVGGNALYVCNPVTQRWRALPEFPGRIKHVFMIDDSSSGSYTVVAVVVPEDFRGGGGVSVLIFDKAGKSWREASAPAGHRHHQQLGLADAALCGGVLYFLLDAGLSGGWQFIRKYELGTGIWSDLRAPMPGSFRSSDLMQSAYLVGDEERLLLVEKVISSSGGLSGPGMRASVGVYELDPESREWRSFEGRSLEKVSLFVGSFTSRAIRREDGPGGRLVYFSNNGSAVNVYDVERGSWHRLPEFPREKMISTMSVRRPRDKLGVVIPFRGLWFEPRLDSTV